MHGALGLLLIAQAECERKEEYGFYKATEKLNPGERKRVRVARAEIKENARKEATEERRHREMCSAVRSISPRYWWF